MNQPTLNKTQHFRLFAHCIPVQGALRSVLYDIQRGAYEFIPSILAVILTKHKHKTIQQIIAIFGAENENIIIEYFQFLLDKEYIFQLEKEALKLFPDLSMHWEHPGYVQNAILDFNTHTKYDIKSAIDELEELGCKEIQLRFFDKINLKKIAQICKYCDGHRIRLLEIIAPYQQIDEETLEQFFKDYPRVVTFYMFMAPFSKVYETEKYIPIIYTEQNITNETHCGIINANGFTVTQGLFIEAQKHNSCLNHKISIDVNGNIKNCPSMQKSYGNIKDTTLTEALNKKGFKDNWHIHKDQIEACKDCEFRYMCTDCRAYIEQPNDKFSKPLKCGYNPYTTEWEEWSTNPLKQKAIKYYKIQTI